MVLCSLFSFSATAFAAAPAPTEETQPVAGSTYPVFAETKYGKILGYNEDGVNIFKGIPYAKAKRFEMPTKPDSWDDVLNCVVYSAVCPQVQGFNGINTSEASSITDSWSMDLTESKFLTVNVWSTDMNPDTPKPVIFWIHGGGYDSGSANELKLYDGKNLAEYGDVVFVSINHRLNYLGYLDLSAYGSKFKNSGNVGHADLIMGLEWVRDNIANFGGDPNNVTIEGQSGGGSKVTQLMSMPAAQGLFHKAVAQSGGSVSITRTTEDAQAEAAALVEYLGLSGKTNKEITDYLQNMEYKDLADACKAAGVRTGGVCDGKYVLSDFSISKDIPVMFGSIMAEFSGNGLNMMNISYQGGGNGHFDEEWFYQSYRPYMTDKDVDALLEKTYGKDTKTIKAAYEKAYPGKDPFYIPYVANRTNEKAEAFTKMGGTAYQFVQGYILPMFGGITPWHTGGDIAWFFRNTDVMHMWLAGDEETADKISQTMDTALVNFAYTGDPSQDGLAWPAFSIKNGETMIFDVESEVRGYHDADLMKALAPYQRGFF